MWAAELSRNCLPPCQRHHKEEPRPLTSACSNPRGSRHEGHHYGPWTPCFCRSSLSAFLAAVWVNSPFWISTRMPLTEKLTLQVTINPPLLKWQSVHQAVYITPTSSKTTQLPRLVSRRLTCASKMCKQHAWEEHCSARMWMHRIYRRRKRTESWVF